MTLKRTFWGLFWVTLCGFFPSEGLAQGSEAGAIVLSRIEGNVTVTNNATGEVTPATNGRFITEGFTVTTAAEAQVILVFSNGSTVNLGSDSVLNIERYLQDPFAEELELADMAEEPTTSTTEVRLTQGELVGNVKKLKEGSSFKVNTPAGAAGIRGTTFRIVFRPTGDGRATFSLTMLEGEIEFEPEGEVDSSVNVSADQEIAVEVTIDEATGEVTVTMPDGGIVTTVISDQSKTSLNEVVQKVFEAVAEVVVKTNPTGPGTGGGSGSGSGGNAEPPTKNAPPAPITAPRPTPTDGKA